MTEAEAKTKWCPLTRLHLNQAFLDERVHCIGSACMMFRSIPDQFLGAVDYNTGLPMAGPKTADATCYCGLAGKP